METTDLDQVREFLQHNFDNQIGRFDDTRYFAITERCAGRLIAYMADADIYPVLPELFDIAGEIHRIDISRFRGWGLTDASGNGRFASWRQYLLSLYDQKFTFDLPDLARRTFFELDVYEAYLAEMKQLLPYCPEERYLVHGDYGFDNVLADGQRYRHTRLGR